MITNFLCIKSCSKIKEEKEEEEEDKRKKIVTKSNHIYAS